MDSFGESVSLPSEEARRGQIPKAVEGIIIKYARGKTTTLAGMTEAARQAIALPTLGRTFGSIVQSDATE
jgi:hypothetical protein